MSGRAVEVRYLKHPSTLHWQHRMVALGEDRWGAWLGAGPGREVRKGDADWYDLGCDYVQLVVPGGWWTAIFNDETSPIEVYVDIVTPPVWDGAARVTMVDLDLDVLRTTDGRVVVVDEDEFLLHQRLLGYPAHWVERAPLVAAEVAEMLAGEAPELVAAGASWLGAHRGG